MTFIISVDQKLKLLKIPLTLQISRLAKATCKSNTVGAQILNIQIQNPFKIGTFLKIRIIMVWFWYGQDYVYSFVLEPKIKPVYKITRWRSKKSQQLEN